MPELTSEEFNLFRDFIERTCGIHLAQDKSYLVEHRLARIIRQTGCKTYEELYWRSHREEPSGELCTGIIDAITTNETSWFRDPKQFEALRDFLLPELYADIQSGKRRNIHIWSAACSTGQEPYTIAMVVLDYFRYVVREPELVDKVRILATDISGKSIHFAETARYDETLMSRGLPEDQRRRHFKKTGDHWRANDDVVNMVDFKRFNLRDPFVGLGPFDIIFLRNVVIYFGDELKKNIFSETADCLHPKGWLLLGTGEAVSGLSKSFQLQEKNGAILYRLT